MLLRYAIWAYVYVRRPRQIIQTISLRNPGTHRYPVSRPSITLCRLMSSQSVEASRLSRKQFCELLDLYSEAVLEYSGYAREQGSNIQAHRLGDVITIDASGVGSFILRSDPRSKQITLESPISGSKVFDWVVRGQKQYIDDGMTMGAWLFLKDGKNLSAILNAELGLEMEMLFG
ncbi:hypothetical protein LA080_014639 [Diaporthe eres]|uniref:Uncharacterized protein n=1 Tax=Diaporthe vaccinii TaxID=105482 RepID=A0ABR4EL77_9PEZI|nr:hypothetical protein LA080_014639 [Diaporthe eres]